MSFDPIMYALSADPPVEIVLDAYGIDIWLMLGSGTLNASVESPELYAQIRAAVDARSQIRLVQHSNVAYEVAYLDGCAPSITSDGACTVASAFTVDATAAGPKMGAVVLRAAPSGSVTVVVAADQ